MILLAGPDVRAQPIRGASVYDVFPTVLYLLGLPVPDDVPGRVLAEAISPSVLRTRPLLRVPSLGSRDLPNPRPVTTEGEAKELERLKQLGYRVE